MYLVHLSVVVSRVFKLSDKRANAKANATFATRSHLFHVPSVSPERTRYGLEHVRTLGCYSMFCCSFALLVSITLSFMCSQLAVQLAFFINSRLSCTI